MWPFKKNKSELLLKYLEGDTSFLSETITNFSDVSVFDTVSYLQYNLSFIDLAYPDEYEKYFKASKKNEGGYYRYSRLYSGYNRKLYGYGIWHNVEYFFSKHNNYLRADHVHSKRIPDGGPFLIAGGSYAGDFRLFSIINGECKLIFRLQKNTKDAPEINKVHGIYPFNETSLENKQYIIVENYLDKIPILLRAFIYKVHYNMLLDFNYLVKKCVKKEFNKKVQTYSDIVQYVSKK